jgi:hypothetical protein
MYGVFYTHKIFIVMDLNKLIREEIKSMDFDWVKDVTPRVLLSELWEKEGYIEEGDILILSGYLADSMGDESMLIDEFKIEVVQRRPKLDHSSFKPLDEISIRHLNYGGDIETISFAPIDGYLEVLKIIKPEKDLQESNEFDWIKKIEPIKFYDLVGYYFTYKGPTKYHITGIVKDSINEKLDAVKFEAVDPRTGKKIVNMREGRDFVSFIKDRVWVLYEPNGQMVDPRNLLYPSGSFGRGEIKENKDSDFQWLKNVKPIPNSIEKFMKSPKRGSYKIWLGDIPKEQQLAILDYITKKANELGIGHADDFLIRPRFREKISEGNYILQALFFKIYFLKGIKKMAVTQMGYTGLGGDVEKENSTDYNLNYYKNKDSKEL